MHPFSTALCVLLLGAALASAPSTAEGGGSETDDPQGGHAAPAAAIHPSLEPLRAWLAHKDWTVRSMAAFELRTRTTPGTIRLATELLAVETHPYAAAGALSALRGRPRRELVMEGGPALVEVLLRFCRTAHPTVAGYAREVLYRIPRVKLGTNLPLYEGWWKRGEKALAREQLSLLAQQARVARTTADLLGKPSSSAAPDDKAKEFYERLELMRMSGLELCIVMDDTGSMRPTINAARAGAKRMIERLRAFVPRVRAGLVSYKDAPYFRIGLTQNVARLEKAFGKMSASGGMDHEEGVDKGIMMAISKTEMAWSRDAYRVVVVVGDAPPHDDDVMRLLRFLQKQKDDLLFEQPVIVHTVSTSALPVLHFQRIAHVGGGQHVTLADSGSLVDALVLLAFGGTSPERIRNWMREIDALRAAEPRQAGPK